MLDKLETELKIRGFTARTVDSYTYNVRKFLDFLKNDPKEAVENDAKRYIAHLMSDKKYRPSSVNLAISSLKFFYKEILQNPAFNAVKAQKLEKKLPTVLTKEEMKKLLNVIKNP